MLPEQNEENTELQGPNPFRDERDEEAQEGFDPYNVEDVQQGVPNSLDTEAEEEQQAADETPAEDLEEGQEGDIQEGDDVPLDETIKLYRILGMVDYTDETGNIVGQLPVGSVHELPAFTGDLAVEEGRAEEVQ